MTQSALQLDLHPALLDAVSRMAEARDVTMGQLVRDLLARELSQGMAHPPATRLGTRDHWSGKNAGTRDEVPDFEVIEPF